MTKANSQQPIQHQVSSSEEKKDEIFEKQTTTGRIINSVTLPPSNRLTAEELFPNDKIDTKLLRDHLKQEGRLTEECALKVIKEGVYNLYDKKCYQWRFSMVNRYISTRI